MLPLTSLVSGTKDDTCSSPVRHVICVRVERVEFYRKQTEGLCMVWHVCFILTNTDRIVGVCV